MLSKYPFINCCEEVGSEGNARCEVPAKTLLEFSAFYGLGESVISINCCASTFWLSSDNETNYFRRFLRTLPKSELLFSMALVCAKIYCPSSNSNSMSS